MLYIRRYSFKQNLILGRSTRPVCPFLKWCLLACVCYTKISILDSLCIALLLAPTSPLATSYSTMKEHENRGKEREEQQPLVESVHHMRTSWHGLVYFAKISQTMALALSQTQMLTLTFNLFSKKKKKLLR